jgi:hypothetical protein
VGHFTSTSALAPCRWRCCRHEKGRPYLHHVSVLSRSVRAQELISLARNTSRERLPTPSQRIINYSGLL